MDIMYIMFLSNILSNYIEAPRTFARRTERAALPDQLACAYLTVIARDPEGVL